MTMDPLDLFTRATDWTVGTLVPGATDALDAPTPCDEWNVRQVMNHMLDTQRFFACRARGDDNVAPPSPEPPDQLGTDPDGDSILYQFVLSRTFMLVTFGEEGVIERTGPSLGIAFADQLIHGWDLAKATGQDATMPDGLAEAAYEMLEGRLTDEQRKGAFKPEIAVDPAASTQDKLLAYTGRDPAG
jgi:uncharacterized protein (TIGR03083 family)